MIKTKSSAFFALAIIAILHTVGFIGLNFSPWADLCAKLTPINLLITFFLVLFAQEQKNKTFFIYLSVCALIGFGMEVIGVKTGLIFGDYSYGASLGPKLADVPLMIGLNWALLVLCTGMIAQRTKFHFVIKAIIAASLMVLIDFPMEPFAIKYDLWDWAQHPVPLQNYIAWFLIAFVLLLGFDKSIHFKENKVAEGSYFIMIIFFLANFMFI